MKVLCVTMLMSSQFLRFFYFVCDCRCARVSRRCGLVGRSLEVAWEGVLFFSFFLFFERVEDNNFDRERIGIGANLDKNFGIFLSLSSKVKRSYEVGSFKKLFAYLFRVLYFFETTWRYFEKKIHE